MKKRITKVIAGVVVASSLFVPMAVQAGSYTERISTQQEWKNQSSAISIESTNIDSRNWDLVVQAWDDFFEIHDQLTEFWFSHIWDIAWDIRNGIPTGFTRDSELAFLEAFEYARGQVIYEGDLPGVGAQETLNWLHARIEGSQRAYDNLVQAYNNLTRPTVRNGWTQSGGNWFFYSNGNRVTGWREIGGVWYHFATNGRMNTGWVSSAGGWYFMDNEGAMQTGWVQSGGNWFHLAGSGRMQTGWQQIGGVWYHFASGGQMDTGWVQSGGSWFFMENSGAMRTGWVSSGGMWFFMDNGGHMQTGWLLNNGQWFFLNNNGAMQTGWTVINGVWHHFNASGVWLG